MNNGNGVSRGDRNRNARPSELRAAVPVTNAIVGIDLARPGIYSRPVLGKCREQRSLRRRPGMPSTPFFTARTKESAS